MPAEKPK